MTENSTSEPKKSKSKKNALKESFIDEAVLGPEPSDLPIQSASPPPTPPGPYNSVPGFVQKLGGFLSVAGQIDDFVKSLGLPPFVTDKRLNLFDYRLVIEPPRGIPFRLGVRVVYRPGTPEERDLEHIFRIGR